MTHIRRNLLLAAFLFALPALALAQEAYTSRTVNVRAGPDASYPVVAQLPPGAGLQVMGCISGYSWCDVVFGPNRGWVYAGSLVYPYQSRRVPILGYGATIGLPIISFSIGNYWDNYYRGRPWYRNRSYWVNRGPRHFDRPQPRPAPPRAQPRYDRPPAMRPDRPGFQGPGNRPSRPEGSRQENRPRGNSGGGRDRPGGNPPTPSDANKG